MTATTGPDARTTCRACKIRYADHLQCGRTVRSPAPKRRLHERDDPSLLPPDASHGRVRADLVLPQPVPSPRRGHLCESHPANRAFPRAARPGRPCLSRRRFSGCGGHVRRSDVHHVQSLRRQGTDHLRHGSRFGPGGDGSISPRSPRAPPVRMATLISWRSASRWSSAALRSTRAT